MTTTVPVCQACDASLDQVLVDLGTQPLANAYLVQAEVETERRYPLLVRVCANCFLVQAEHSIPADEIFTKEYAYFSSYSSSWVEHAKRYAAAMIERFGLSADSQVVEIASNDGYLLQHFKARDIPVLGIEPTENTANAAIEKGIPTETVFFSRATAQGLVERGLSADLTAANNVLAHVPDIRDFVGGFSVLLKPTGVSTFEFPHLLNMIRLNQFDTIYHEHYSYLSLTTVHSLFRDCGLQVFDVEELPTHGGSLRVYACRSDHPREETPALAKVLQDERAGGLDRIEGYQDFEAKVRSVKDGFLSFLASAKQEGKKVAAYGAAAKGNTFLNYCGVGADDLLCVADISKAKQGKLLPGSHVPIVAPSHLAEVQPDYIVILPWNLTDEITGQLKDASGWGAKFVVAIPSLRIF